MSDKPRPDHYVHYDGRVHKYRTPKTLIECIFSQCKPIWLTEPVAEDTTP